MSTILIQKHTYSTLIHRKIILTSDFKLLGIEIEYLESDDTAHKFDLRHTNK